ncbi:dethiobiotin synthase [soil metagenome]
MARGGVDELLARPALFVTGTDTDIGKTFVSCAIARAWRARGDDVCAMKPVAAGGERDADGNFLCDDSKLLSEVTSARGRAAMMLATGLMPTSPLIGLDRAMAPWSAAVLQGAKIDFTHLAESLGSLEKMCAMEKVKLLAEGAGGALVPLCEGKTVADLIAEIKWPAVIVARTELGTINHTLLTVEALRARGIEIAAVVFSRTREGEFTEIERAGFREIDAILPQGIPLLMVKKNEPRIARIDAD